MKDRRISWTGFNKKGWGTFIRRVMITLSIGLFMSCSLLLNFSCERLSLHK